MPWLDPLKALDDDDDSSSSGGGEGEGDAVTGEVEGAGAKEEGSRVTLEALERNGFKGGPSVLLVRERHDADQPAWNWGDGRDRSAPQPSRGDRRAGSRDRAAAAEGAESLAKASLAAAAKDVALRKAERAEIEAQRKRRKRDPKASARRSDEG